MRMSALKNIDAEMAVLGALLIEGDRIDDVRERLAPSDFFRTAHEIIYQTMLDLADAGVEIDAVTLCDRLEAAGVFNKIGGDDVIGEIAGCVPHAANIRYHADIVRQKSVARQVYEAAVAIIGEVSSMARTSSDLLAFAESSLFAIGDSAKSASVKSPAQYIAEAKGQIALRQAGEVTGVESGWVDLDKLTGGFRNQSMVVIAARPSMGKTAMALNISEHNSVTLMPHPKRGLFVSLEMNSAEIGERLIVARAGLDSARIRAGIDLRSEEVINMEEASDSIVVSSLYVDEAAIRSVSEIGSIARRHSRDHGLDYICVDYLQLLMPDGDLSNRQEQVAGISRSLKSLAKQLNVPVIVMSQLNRLSESRADKRPMLSDLRESGAIEQDADVVVLLHRPAYYDPSDRPGVAEVIVAKNRNGPTGIVNLVWQSQSMRFENMSMHAYSDEYYPS
jgi:replicative DNA helicase